MTESKETYHTPALLEASVASLNVVPDGVYVDATYGGGGHSRAILARLGKKGRLFAFDRDADARLNLPDDRRLVFVCNNFRFMNNFLRYCGVGQVNGILADLGVSSHHFDESSRGFSFRFPEAELDMRMNREADLTARHTLNTYTQEQLRHIFTDYGEIDRQAGRLAGIIVERRRSKPLSLVADLNECIAQVAPRRDERQFYAKVFQSIRIEVNREITSLKHFLEQSAAALSVGGRLSVISYHSIEDRMVKNFIKTGNTDGVERKDFYGNGVAPFVAVNRKVIVPDDAEVAGNSRSRSAKLRIAEKKYG
jgi:16S rRNA (cytosine1402-N4)-methyltransferase